MEKQISFTDLEYGKRRKVTKREVFFNEDGCRLAMEGMGGIGAPLFPGWKARPAPAGDRGDAAYADAAGMVPSLR